MRNKTRVPTLPFLFKMVLKFIARSVKQKKVIKRNSNR
jgi:hypothetical protein